MWFVFSIPSLWPSCALIYKKKMQLVMNNPQFLQQMSAMMSDSTIVDQMVTMDPQMQAYTPQMCQMFQNPQFRELMYMPFLFSLHPNLNSVMHCLVRSDPQCLWQMLELSAMIQGTGGGGGHSACWGVVGSLLQCTWEPHPACGEHKYG